MPLTIGPINAATPTPLRHDGSFDRESARRLCRRWIEIGLDGVLVLGSMGEGLLLPPEVRTAFVQTALDEAGDKLTLFISASDRSFEAMCGRAMQYASMGASCVVLTAPMGVTSREAVDQVRKVADRCPAPCAYYDVPSVTGVTLYRNEIEEILSHPNIRAFKDSSNNALLAQALTASVVRKHVKLLDGVEYRVCYSAALGYDGVIHGGAVMTGRRVRSIWNKAQSGQMLEALVLDRENSLCLGNIYNRLTGPVQNIAGQKYALKLLGLFADEGTLVDQVLDPAAHERIARAVEENREWLA